MNDTDAAAQATHEEQPKLEGMDAVRDLAFSILRIEGSSAIAGDHRLDPLEDWSQAAVVALLVSFTGVPADRRDTVISSLLRLLEDHEEDEDVQSAMTRAFEALDAADEVKQAYIGAEGTFADLLETVLIDMEEDVPDRGDEDGDQPEEDEDGDGTDDTADLDEDDGADGAEQEDAPDHEEDRED